MQTGLGTLNAAWNPSSGFGVGADASFINLSPLDISASVAGALESAHLSYNVRGTIQPLGAAAVADAFDAFASVLGASQAYFGGSLDLTEDITGFIPAAGLLKAAQLELDCDYRQPLQAADAWNLQYLQLNVGPFVAFKGGLSVSAYYNFLYSNTSLST